MKRVLLALIRFYRGKISPARPSCCRFIPTCSTYALEAVEVHGALKGGLLSEAYGVKDLIFPLLYKVLTQDGQQIQILPHCCLDKGGALYLIQSQVEPGQGVGRRGDSRGDGGRVPLVVGVRHPREHRLP